MIKKELYDELVTKFNKCEADISDAEDAISQANYRMSEIETALSPYEENEDELYQTEVTNYHKELAIILKTKLPESTSWKLYQQ